DVCSSDLKWRMNEMKLKMLALLVFAFLLLGACSNEDNGADITSDADIKQLVQDYTMGEAEAASASITSSELIVTDENEEETTYDLAEDEFFVSIAPFVSETHECTIHSLTGCQRERVNEDSDIHIENSSGDVILDETKEIEANGFVDIWLPKEDTYDVTIIQDGKETTTEISTFDGDKTCITDMQLK